MKMVHKNTDTAICLGHEAIFHRISYFHKEVPCFKFQPCEMHYSPFVIQTSSRWHSEGSGTVLLRTTHPFLVLSLSRAMNQR